MEGPDSLTPRRFLSVDPAVQLPLELFTAVLAALRPADLSRAMRVSMAWLAASQHPSVWDAMCEALWADKVYVPPHCVRLRREGRGREAYRTSLLDAERTHLSKEELCSFQWYFRFKRAAGNDWVRGDPWWQGKRPTGMQFLPDGGMALVNPAGEPTALPPEHVRVQRKWRFITGGREGPEGSFVRVNNFPPYIVSRYAPNWGFLMQSCWVVWTSFPMPPRGHCLALEDAALNAAVNVSTMEREAIAYNLGLQIPFIQHLEAAQLEVLLAMLGQNQQQQPHDGEEDDEDEEEDGEDDDPDPATD